MNSDFNIKYLYALRRSANTNASQNIARIAQCTCDEELQRKCKACKYIKEKKKRFKNYHDGVLFVFEGKFTGFC